MSSNILATVFAVTLTFAAAPVLAGNAIAQGGDVNAGAVAQASGAALDSVSNNSGSSLLPFPLVAGANALSTLPTGEWVSASATSMAQWTSADAGSVTLSIARAFTVDSSVGGYAAHNNANPSWTYTFTTTANGTFDLTYNVTAFGGSAFGMDGWDFDISGVSPVTLSNVFNPATSGTLSVALLAGTQYVARLTTNSNISGGVNSGFDSAIVGQFDWTITGGAVPEPASWAMMISGFGMIGGTMRRRRMVAA